MKRRQEVHHDLRQAVGFFQHHLCKLCHFFQIEGEEICQKLFQGTHVEASQAHLTALLGGAHGVKLGGVLSDQDRKHVVQGSQRVDQHLELLGLQSIGIVEEQHQRLIGTCPGSHEDCHELGCRKQSLGVGRRFSKGVRQLGYQACGGRKPRAKHGLEPCPPTLEGACVPREGFARKLS